MTDIPLYEQSIDDIKKVATINVMQNEDGRFFILESKDGSDRAYYISPSYGIAYTGDVEGIIHDIYSDEFKRAYKKFGYYIDTVSP